MRKISKLFTVGTLCLSVLTACSDMTKQDTGVLAGGAVGGLLGSQFGNGSGQAASIIAGSLIGAFLGGQVGKNMDKVDKMEAENALETQKTGQSTSWKNPDTGNSYEMTPTKTFKKANTDCRDFTMVVTYEDGPTDTIKGTACRTDKGWVEQ